jgi:hypothetical protein
MKRKLNTPITLLKVTCIVCMVIFSSLALISFKSQQVYGDLWSQLGLGKQDGTDKIKESFLYGYLQYYGARNIKNIVAGDRAATAKSLLEYTRQYVESEGFKKEYTNHRNGAKPALPNQPKNLEQIRKENVESIKNSIAETEKGMKTIDEQYKKIYENSLIMLKKQLKEYEDPNNKMLKFIAESEQQQYEQHMQEYEANTKAWEVKFPASHLAFVKARLQQVLDATADVDFNAQLVERNNKKYFVNRDYERKSANWKYAFRAGKEVTQTVRQYAEQWVKEIK